MAETSIFDNSWVDMVFEGRNQQYGAFVLRKKSSNYTLKGIIFSIIGLVFLKIDPTKNNMSALKLLYQPLLLLIIVLLWNISITLRFYDKINKQTVPTQYFMWSWFSTILITTIIIISILSYVSDNEKSFTIYNYILLIFNFIVTAIQQVVLESFTVDGFTN
jgi:Na+/H+-translocating membrane pyrophosphatase